MAAPPALAAAGAVPASNFASIVRDYQQRRTVMREEHEKLRVQVLDGVAKYTDGLMESVNSEVAVAFDRQRAIEAEIKQLQKETGDFVKRSNQWVALVAGFSQSLKEIGDIENWSRAIESDMADVANTLTLVHARSSGVGSGGGGSAGGSAAH